MESRSGSWLDAAMTATVRMEVFFPAKLFDVDALDRAIENSLSMTAEAIKVDLSAVTRTWKDRPDMRIEKMRFARLIHADTGRKAGKVFDMLDAGTKPHIIRAKNVPRLRFRAPGFQPKTAVRRLYSGAGKEADGPVRAPVMVHHPGTEAREWYDEVTKKWEDEAPAQLQRAVDVEVSR